MKRSWLSVLVLAACRQNPECFGSDECVAGTICFEQECRDPRDVDAGPVMRTWFRDVEPIVIARCQSCHARPPVNQAPMSLVEYNDVRGTSLAGNPLIAEMALRVASNTEPMPPVSQEPLTAEQIQVFVDWAATGGAPGNAGSRPDSGVIGQNPLLGVPAVTQVQTGYLDLFGLAWNNAGEVLFFADGPGNTIYGLAQTGVQTFRTPGDIPRGLAVDSMNQLITAEVALRRVSRTVGEATVLPVVELFETHAFNGPYDVEVTGDGAIFFTDPAEGLMGRAREINFNGLYVVPSGAATANAVWQGPVGSAPSGLALGTADGVLYMSDAVDDVIRAFDVGFNGAISNERIFALTAPEPRGLAVDAAGNVWVATSAGLEAYNPSGLRWGVLLVPRIPSNVAFGGNGLTTLYIAAESTLYRTVATIPGIP
ncbi:MAG: SMP-30/gluconolactonase/LRE family protein [Deltaproteobacteria bacterium]|jgi:gluconolactonase|nr:SMP-30/gluconolactonase/LRE family protein [Deltaproteobacteria bacterium]